MNHSHPVEQFHFPMEIYTYKRIRDLPHFHEMINRQNNLSRRNIIFEPTMITGSDGVETLNLQCKHHECDSYFRYIRLKKGQQFNIKDYNQRHQHVLKQTHTYHQTIIDRINKFLQQEDNRQELHDLRGQMEVTYRISSKEFEQLYSQAVTRLKNNSQLYDGRQIQELCKKLKNQRYSVIVDTMPSKVDRENKTITKSILVMSDNMAANYRKYGECCYLTVEEKYHLNRWYVGAIMGLARDMELTTFGIFLMKTVDSDHLKGVLKGFIGSIQQKPKTFVTQSHFYYDQALNQLKQQGFIQSQHVYDYAIHCERLHRNNPKFRKIFSELCKEPLKRVFFSKLQQYYNSQNFYEIEMDLQELAGLAQKFCLSQIKSVPVGPYRTIRHKVTQKKTDFSIIRAFHKIVMEKECTNGKDIYKKFKSIINLLTYAENEELAEKNRIMDIFPELCDLRQEVTKCVMEHIMNKVYASLQFRVNKIDQQTFKVSDVQDFVMVRKQNQKWMCECQQSIKTMLPCVHEILVCCRTNGSFLSQIKRRWSNEDKYLEEQLRKKVQKKSGRTKRVTLSDFLA